MSAPDESKDQRLKQVDAARLLGVPQPKVSALVNYRLDGFSAEKLMAFIVALGRDVDIIVRPARCGGAVVGDGGGVSPLRLTARRCAVNDCISREGPLPSGR